MRVVVTGGAGRLGQFTIKELADHGYDVVAVDKVPMPENFSRSLVIDLLRAQDLAVVFERAEGVIHLARQSFPYTVEGFDPASRSWKTPDVLSDAATFNYNVTISYNVVAAAFAAGVKKLAMGSSLYGFYYPSRLSEPDYLPVDEGHPLRPQDPYGISKLVAEHACDAFARKSEMQIASLRFAGICTDSTHQILLERRNEPLRRAGTLWTYLDARDAAIACRLAVEASFAGHESFNICAPNMFMKTPTLELIKQYFPDVQLRTQPEGIWSGYDPEKARKTLGFVAKYRLEGG